MAEKTGINLYYDYLDNEFIELSLEEIGAITIAILATDCKKEIRDDAQKVINSDRMLRTLFNTMSGKTKRATKKWHDMDKRFEKSRAIKSIMEGTGCSEEEAKKIYEYGIKTTQDNKEKKEPIQEEKKNVPEKWRSLYRKEPFGPDYKTRKLVFPDGEIIYAHYEKFNEPNVYTQEELEQEVKLYEDKTPVKDKIADLNKCGWNSPW